MNICMSQNYERCFQESLLAMALRSTLEGTLQARIPVIPPSFKTRLSSRDTVLIDLPRT